MTPRVSIFRHAALSWVLLLGCIALPSQVVAQTELGGEVRDALTGTTLPGSRVVVLELGLTTWTNEQGRYFLDVPEGEWTLLVDAEDPSSGQIARGVLARQSSTPGTVWPATAWIYGLPLYERLPRLTSPVGYPSSATRVAGDGPAHIHDWMRARGSDPDKIQVTMPSQLPSTIRVGRRFAGNCRDNPVQRIDHVPIEEYVEGVLYGEIRVFKAAQTGEDSAREVFKAFAVAARTYALWFVVRADPDDEYDLDDTACNQRYVDDRDPYIETLVAETTGEVLIRSGTTDEFDKFEYAASCGRHSTLPEYQDERVSDAGLERVCVGNWCGHDDCAAHQDHPDVPGEDRCLVRGICQWGSLERAAGGASYLEILSHYQPNLDVRNFGPDAPTTGTVRGYVRTGEDIETGTPVVTAMVSIDGGPITDVSSMGYFEFRGIDAGSHELHVEAEGFESFTTQVEVTVGEETWASVLLQVSNSTSEDIGMDTTESDLDHTPDLGMEHDLIDPDQPTDAPDAPGLSTGLPAFGHVPDGGLPDSSCGCATHPRSGFLWPQRR